MLASNVFLNERGIDKFSVGSQGLYGKACLAAQSQLSNTCFLHRICWNSLFDYGYQMVDDLFCLVADDNCINKAHLVFPIGKVSENTLRQVLRYWLGVFEKYNKPFRIEFVEEDNLGLLKECLEKESLKLQVSRCDDCADYIYRREDYLNLQGKANRKKRLFVNRYNNHCDDYRIELVSSGTVDDCLALCNQWEKRKKIPLKERIATDFYPHQFFWENIELIDNTSYLLYYRGEPVAFFVASSCGTRCTFHFAKSDRSYSEANFLLHYIFLNSEQGESFSTLNFEDDMGIREIRDYKEHVAACHKIHKYSVEVER